MSIAGIKSAVNRSGWQQGRNTVSIFDSVQRRAASCSLWRFGCDRDL